MAISCAFPIYIVPRKRGNGVRASTLVFAKFFPFYTSKTYFFYFIHLFLQNTHISLSIIHIYSNKIFNFFNIVNSNRERREKGKESEVKRGEKKKE